MRTVPCATETICHVQMRTSSNFAEQSDTFVKLGLTQPFNFFPSKKRPFPVRNSIQRKTLKARCIKQPLFGDTAEKSTAQRQSSGQRLLGKKKRHSTMSHRRHRKAPFVAENDGNCCRMRCLSAKRHRRNKQTRYYTTQLRSSRFAGFLE